MGDDKDSFVFYEPGKCLLNGSFVLHIQTGGGFVQQNDGRILQEGAGNGNALTLAARKGAAVFPDVRVPLVRQLFGKFLAVGKVRRREDLLIKERFCSTQARQPFTRSLAPLLGKGIPFCSRFIMSLYRAAFHCTVIVLPYG